MEFFADGKPVRLRSRASDLLLYADEDGVGVSLSPLRASPRTSWEVRHVERHGAAYVILQSAADGRYLAISPDPAPTGARGLRAVQNELIGVAWRARLAGDGGSDVLIRHPVHGVLCPMGCAAGVGVRQRVNGRSSLLPRWSVEPAPVAPPPPVIPPGEPEPEQEPEPEPEAPGQPLAVQAMMTEFDRLQQGMDARHGSIRDLVYRIRVIERLARTGTYNSETPIRKAVEKMEEEVVMLLESYNTMKIMAEELYIQMEGEGVAPMEVPVILREKPEDSFDSPTPAALPAPEGREEQQGDYLLTLLSSLFICSTH